MPNMITRIRDFIDWLKENTDFGEWNPAVQEEVHKALIVYMISESKEPTNANDE